jgi:hypothetical protein
LSSQKNIVEKCVRVINSCITQSQVKSAINYVNLVYKYLENTNLQDELTKLVELKEKVLFYDKFKENNKE